MHLTTSDMRKGNAEEALKKKNPFSAQTMPWWDTTPILRLKERERGRELFLDKYLVMGYNDT